MSPQMSAIVGSVTVAAGLTVLVLTTTDRTVDDWLLAVLLWVSAGVGRGLGEYDRATTAGQRSAYRLLLVKMAALAGVLVLQVLVTTERASQDWLAAGVWFLVLGVCVSSLELVHQRRQRRPAPGSMDPQLPRV
jgi:hypothetical protein